MVKLFHMFIIVIKFYTIIDIFRCKMFKIKGSLQNFKSQQRSGTLYGSYFNIGFPHTKIERTTWFIQLCNKIFMVYTCLIPFKPYKYCFTYTVNYILAKTVRGNILRYNF